MVAEEGWDGAVPAYCTCCLMLGYCVVVDEITSLIVGISCLLSA